jgi:hypothetical protein
MYGLPIFDRSIVATPTVQESNNPLYDFFCGHVVKILPIHKLPSQDPIIAASPRIFLKKLGCIKQLLIGNLTVCILAFLPFSIFGFESS